MTETVAASKDIFQAIENNNTDALRACLQQSNIDINACNAFGYTPLHIATRFGHSECVKLLLAYPNIDVNIKGSDGTTPLFCAIERDDAECVRALLKHRDIDMNITNKRNIKPLHYAILYNQSNSIKLLLEQEHTNITIKDKSEKRATDTATGSTSQHNDETTSQLETNTNTLSTNPTNNTHSKHTNNNPPVTDAKNKSKHNDAFTDTLLLNEPHEVVGTHFTQKTFAHDANNVITIKNHENIST